MGRVEEIGVIKSHVYISGGAFEIAGLEHPVGEGLHGKSLAFSLGDVHDRGASLVIDCHFLLSVFIIEVGEIRSDFGFLVVVDVLAVEKPGKELDLLLDIDLAEPQEELGILRFVVVGREGGDNRIGVGGTEL